MIKNEQNPPWIQAGISNPTSILSTIPKVTLLAFLALITSLYIFYSLKILPFQTPPNPIPQIPCIQIPPNATESKPPAQPKTVLHHVVFAIGATSKLWDHRKNYIKVWFKPEKNMRAVVWLDEPVEKEESDELLLPPALISGDTSEFPYNHQKGNPAAIRLSMIISETVKLGLKDVRWLVMGDDDTVFVPENLVRVLGKYDYREFYYIGSVSESHVQNIYFSYGMAFGGGGFAVSYRLAEAMAKMQDRCIRRYPGLYGSDDRVQACMAELGVPLTREVGFHQFDVYGNAFGLLAAHPIAPFVSLHHIDLIEPIFPKMDRFQALKKLEDPIKFDSASLMQQSICYDPVRKWTISVSWGYAVQIIRGIVTAREMERPVRTFLHWNRWADQMGFTTNTRLVGKNVCQWPFVYTLSNVSYDQHQTVSVYVRHGIPNGRCRSKVANPAQIQRVEVYKKPNPNLWDKAPRRNCCRVMTTKRKGSLAVDVGECREDEVIEAL